MGQKTQLNRRKERGKTTMNTLSTKSMSLSCQMLPGVGLGGRSGGFGTTRFNLPEMVPTDPGSPLEDSGRGSSTADGNGGGGGGRVGALVGEGLTETTEFRLLLGQKVIEARRETDSNALAARLGNWKKL